MENISIKVHPPWYARSTPIINTRDGPQMALSENTVYVIKCRKLRLHSVCTFITISALTSLRFGIFNDMKNQNWYKPLFAIREGPSARGNPVEVRSRQSAVGSLNHDSYRMEDQNKGNPGGKTRLWLTLKTTFSNTQNRVYSQWYAQTRRIETIIDDKISISNKPRRGNMIIENGKD